MNRPHGMDSPRVALVLGAGGIVGQAYHAGVLAALEADLGWDPRTADLIVGSSAGSVTATLLRLGVPASDLAAWAVKAPLSVRGSSVIGYLEENREELDRPKLRDFFRPWHFPSAALLARIARRPFAVRPMATLMTLLPSGRVDITHPARLLDDIGPAAWPPGLWICAVRQDDGGRVVFGRPGSPIVALSRAVAASCAIPGYFSPVANGAVRYLDGGVHSPTNADVLRDQDFDLVLAISPMSAAKGRARSIDAPARWLNHLRLERELRLVKGGGTTVVRIEPGPASLSAMGINPMTETRSARIILDSFIETGAHIASDSVRDRLMPLRRARAASDQESHHAFTGALCRGTPTPHSGMHADLPAAEGTSRT